MINRKRIGIDTKKNKPVDDFKNDGRERHPKGQSEPVRAHDLLCQPFLQAWNTEVHEGPYLQRDQILPGMDHVHRNIRL